MAAGAHGLRSPAFRYGVAVALAAVILDQVSKWWILAVVMQPPRIIEVTPFFNIVLTWNRGVSFGMFNDGGSANVWIFGVLALVIVVAMTVWLARVDRPLVGVAIGLVIGGAIGNVIDRVRLGGVVDFLDVHVHGWHWPAFNVADAAICVGAVLLVADALFSRGRST